MGRFGPGMHHEYAGGQSESDLANSISRVLSTARRVNLRIWVNAARTGLATLLDGLNMQNKKATRFIIEWLYVKLNQFFCRRRKNGTANPMPKSAKVDGSGAAVREVVSKYTFSVVVCPLSIKKRYATASV